MKKTVVFGNIDHNNNKVKNIPGVYKITSPSKRVYIGSSVTVRKRMYDYVYGWGKNQIKLSRSIKKYGINKHTFEVIEYCERGDLLKKERYYGDLYNVIKTGLNIVLPGYDDVRGIMSEETRRKIGLGQKGKYKQTPARIRAAQERKGRVVSEEQRRKISAALKGRRINTDVLIAYNKSRKGVPHSESHRKNLTDAIRRLDKTEMSKRNKEIWARTRENRVKIVLNTQTGIFYYGTKEAAESFGINLNTLRCQLRPGNPHRKTTPFIYV